jgi:hypothetical protein
MVKVYIASPYTIGDVAVNVKKQIDVASILMDYGYAPFVPTLAHFQHLMYPRPYQDWLRCDVEWVKCCNALLRLPGTSKGADAEVAVAMDNGLPVFYSIMDLVDALPA